MRRWNDIFVVQTLRHLTKYFSLSMLTLLLVLTACSQQQRFTGWWTTNFGVRVHPKWILNFDSQINSTDQFKKIETVLLRPAIMYRLNNKISLGAGYVYFDNRKTTQGISELVLEHRLWQQLQLNSSRKGINWIHRMRLEQRWVPMYTAENNHLKKTRSNLNNRFRYFTRFVSPIVGNSKKMEKYFWSMQNEIFMNLTGSKFSNQKVVDQIRPSIGIGTHVNKLLDMELGYMFIYSPLPNRGYKINNVARISTTVLL